MRTVNEAVDLGEAIDPKHEVEVVCANCGYDLDESELAADTCSEAPHTAKTRLTREGMARRGSLFPAISLLIGVCLLKRVAIMCPEIRTPVVRDDAVRGVPLHHFVGCSNSSDSLAFQNLGFKGRPWWFVIA